MFTLDGQGPLPVQDRLYKHMQSHGACHGLPRNTHTAQVWVGLILRLCLWMLAVSHWHLRDVLTRSTPTPDKDELREPSFYHIECTFRNVETIEPEYDDHEVM